MKFVDSCQVKVVAGRGGNGAVAFRREKYVPHGGPSGGDGGRGGDVIFVTDSGLSTLLDLTYAHTLKGQDGEHGMGSDCYGKGGQDLVTRVPVGTQVFDAESGVLLYDLDTAGARTVVAAGGKGGRGNMHFATPYDRAPRRAEPGTPGEERLLRLELKVMADVGLLGFPNVGKSTFISAVSRARPKVADYPFTTLVPHLGVVSMGDETTFVVADIPGLIPGASRGAGLGIRFLKHVERTRALLHLISVDAGEGRAPLADYDALVAELGAFDAELAARPAIVAMSKADLPDVRAAHSAVRAAFARRGIALRLVSAATGEGMRELLYDLAELVRGNEPATDREAREAADARRRAASPRGRTPTRATGAASDAPAPRRSREAGDAEGTATKGAAAKTRRAKPSRANAAKTRAAKPEASAAKTRAAKPKASAAKTRAAKRTKATRAAAPKSTTVRSRADRRSRAARSDKGRKRPRTKRGS